MSSIYFLRNDETEISFSVKVGTIGNVGTVAKKRRTGNNVQVVATSTPHSSGNIPDTALGTSSNLINSVLVIETAIVLGKNDNLDQAFQNLFMTITLNGSIDGEQTYTVSDAEKSKFVDTRSIIAVKAVKFQEQ